MSEARAPIQHQNELAPLQQLIQYIGGQRTKGTTSTTSTADVDPLRQIFAQQSSPEALMAMVQSLFQQGAMQVPGLTTQFANATGTRTTGNSMLGQSLALLNQNIAQAIAQSVVQQQANASATAGRIGESTRGEVRQQNTTTAASPRGTGLSLLVPALGVLANQLGKKPAATPKLPPADAEAGYGLGGPDSNTPAPIDAPIAGPIDTGAGVIEPANFIESPMAEFAPGTSTFGADFLDATTFDFAADAGNLDVGVADVAGDVGVESFAEDAVDWFGGADFSFGFADGGRVPAAGSRRNVAQFGARPVIPTTSAISYNNQLIQNRQANPTPSRRRIEVGATSEASEAGVGGTAAGEGGEGHGLGSSQAAGGIGGSGIPAPAAISAMVGLAMGGFPGMVSGFMSGMARAAPAQLAMGQQAISIDIAQQELAAFMEALAQTTGAPVSGMPSGAEEDFGMTGHEGGPGPETGASESFGMTGNEGADPSDTSGVGGEGNDTGESGGGDDSGGDFYHGGMVHGKKKKGYADGGSVGDERAQRYIDSTKKKSNSMGSPSVADELMDVIFKSPIDRRGKNFGVPPGSKDSVSINVTPGEYVLPVDVVELVGVDNLDELVSLTHTPSGGKKRG